MIEGKTYNWWNDKESLKSRKIAFKSNARINDFGPRKGKENRGQPPQFKTFDFLA
jgi:hypothetical protein